MRHFFSVVQTPLGVAVSGATIDVYNAGGTVHATIYSDDGITTTTNPLTSASDGTFGFYVADGRYDLKVSGTGITTRTFADVEIFDATEKNAADGTLTATAANFTTLTVTGTETVATLAVTGNETVGGTLGVTGLTSLKNLDSIRFADQYTGADWTVKVNAADADLGLKGGQIWVSKAAGVSGSTAITLRNTLIFVDDAEYTHKGITIQTGGILIEGMGFSNSGGANFGTRLTYVGAAGSDAISILGQPGAHLDKNIIRNILINGNSTARYGIRCEKCDAGSLQDVRIEGCVTANTYWQDALDWKWYNVASTFMSGYGCIFDGLCGSFDWYGGQFEQGNASTNPQIAISGANNRMSFNGLDMDFNANSGGFFLIQGQDGVNSSFASATAGIGQGRPINIRIGDNVFNYGGAASASSQGADILITDASAAQQPSNIYIENNEFLGSGVGAVSIKADQATRVTIDKNFSNGHTAGAATTVVLTANTSLVEVKRLVSGDSNVLTDPSNVAVLEDIVNASSLSWRIFSGGVRFGAGTTALPALAFSTDTSSGWSRPGAGYWRWSNGGADVFLLSGGGPIINSAKVYGFANGDSFSSSTLTGLSWISQGTIGIGNATAGDTSGNLQLAKITKYNTVSTVSGGIPAEVATVDSTGLTAAVGTTTLYAVPASGAGQYRLCWNAKVTSVGTTSTLGPLTLVWTDPDGVTITTVIAGTQAGGSLTTAGLATNTTSTFLLGTPVMLNAKASTNIQYSFAYASTGSAMQYNLHLKLEAM